jgi:hypothetical protein
MTAHMTFQLKIAKTKAIAETFSENTKYAKAISA